MPEELCQGAKGPRQCSKHRQDAGAADGCQEKHAEEPKAPDNPLSTAKTPEALTYNIGSGQKYFFARPKFVFLPQS